MGTTPKLWRFSLGHALPGSTPLAACFIPINNPTPIPLHLVTVAYKRAALAAFPELNQGNAALTVVGSGAIANNAGGVLVFNLTTEQQRIEVRRGVRPGTVGLQLGGVCHMPAWQASRCRHDGPTSPS